MRKILVLRGGALGDFIVTLPALTLLRRRWPKARIELAGNARAAELAMDCGLLDVVHSQHEARWGILYNTTLLPADFTAWLKEFDLVVSFWPDPDGELRRQFPIRPEQVFLHGMAMPARAPAAAHYCETLRQLEIEPQEYFCYLNLKADRAARAEDVIAIHPGSGSPRKNWPAARWCEVISALPSRVLLILGEAEQAGWSETTLAPLGERIEIAAKLPLKTLALRLAGCRLFLGHDSGISHLAAACGVPSVLLFGPTDPAMWAPPAPHVRVLQRGSSLDAITVADVLAAVRAGQT